MSTLPDISPRADRIIGRLETQLGEALGRCAILEDVNEQLRDELVKAHLPTEEREGGADVAA